MSNEEILEEIYFVVHKHNLLDVFTNEVNRVKNIEGKKTIYEVVNDVYHNFVSEGVIKDYSIS